MLRDIIEIAASYVQYLLLLVGISPSPFPGYYTAPVDQLKYINLDLTNLVSEGNRGGAFRFVPSYIPLDLRTMFILVSVVLPLIVAWTGLLFLTPKRFIIWFAVLTTGIFFLFVGLFHRLANDDNLKAAISERDRDFYTYLGAAIIGFDLIVFLIYVLGKRQERKARMRERQLASRLHSGDEPESPASPTTQKEEDFEEEGKTLEEVEKEETEKVNPWRQAERVAFIVFFGAAGLLFVGIYGIPYVLDVNHAGGTVRTLYWVVGGIFIFIAFLFLISLLLGFSLRGRRIQFTITTFVRDNFVSVLLLVVSLMYVPSVSFIVQVYNCNDFECPPLTRLPDERSLITSSPFPIFNSSNATLDFYSNPLLLSSAINNTQWLAIIPLLYDKSCMLCDLSPFVQRCPVTLQQSICETASQGRRLERDRRIECSGVMRYFWPAGAIMFLSFVVAMPLLNFVLTNRSTKMLVQEFPLDERQSEGYTEEELFEEKVHASDNVAKFIYDPFQLRFKHWRMLFLFQKLGIVFSSVFVVRVSWMSSATIGVSLNLICHTFALLYVIVTTPFTRTVENALTIATQVLLTIACASGLPGTQNAPAPGGYMVFIAVLIFVIPLLSIAIGSVLTFQAGLKKEKQREMRIARAQEAAQEEDEAGEESSPTADGNDVEMEERGGQSPVSPMQTNLPPAVLSPQIGRALSPANNSIAPLEPGGEASPWTGGMRSSLHQSAARAGQELQIRSPPASPVKNSDSTALSFLNPASHMPAKSASPLVRPGAVPLWALPAEERRHAKKALKEGDESNSSAKFGLAKPADKAESKQLQKQKSSEDLSTRAKGIRAARQRTSWRQHNRKGANEDEEPHRPLVKKKSVWAKAREAFIAKIKSDREERERQEAEEQKRQAEEEAKAAQQGLRVKRAPTFFVAGDIDGYDLAGTTSMMSGAFLPAAPKKKKKKFGGAMKNWDALLEALKDEDTRNKIRADLEAADGKEAGHSEDNLLSPGGNPLLAPALRNKTRKKAEDRLRKRLRQLYEEELEKIKRQQQAVDYKINVDTTSVLHIFFVIASLLAFIALLWCGLGIIARREQAASSTFLYVNPDAEYPEPFSNALAGYSTWTDFTNNCCCSAFIDQTASWPFYALDVEKWYCANGKRKEHQRRWIYESPDAENFIINGYAIRPLCGMTFQNACTISQVVSATGTVEAQLTNCDWTAVFNASVPAELLAVHPLNTTQPDAYDAVTKGVLKLW